MKINIGNKSIKDIIEKRINNFFSLNTESFFSTFQKISGDILQNDIKDLKYEYTYPCTDYKIVCDINNYNLTLSFYINNQIYHLSDNDKDKKQIWDNSKEIENILRKEHLNFIEKYSEDFRNEIMNANKYQTFHFTSGYKIACIDNTPNEKVFIERYSGDISNINIDSFRNSKKFTIRKDNNNSKDLQKMYRHASTANLTKCKWRSSFMNNEIISDIITDYERKVVNETKSIQIGNMTIQVMDSNGKKTWYDTNGCIIDKEVVYEMFTWAEEALPQYTITNEYGELENINNIDALALLNIENLSEIGEFEKLVDLAFLYANNKNGMFVNINALRKNEFGDYINETYIFKPNNKLYRITYEDNNYKNNVKTYEEIDIKNFVEMCKQKYNNDIKSVLTEYGKTILNIYIDKGIECNNENILNASKKILSHLYRNKNINYTNLIQKNNINDIDNKIISYIENIKDDGLNLKDVLDSNNDYKEDR